MVTKTRAVKPIDEKTQKTVTHDVLTIPPFAAVADLDEQWHEHDNKNGPTSVGDMDNLVYLYLSEMGQTPKINAAKEKELAAVLSRDGSSHRWKQN